MTTHAPRALSTRLRALAGDDAEGNPHLRTMRSAAVVSLVAGLLLLVSGVTTGDVALMVLAGASCSGRESSRWVGGWSAP